MPDFKRRSVAFQSVEGADSFVQKRERIFAHMQAVGRLARAQKFAAAHAAITEAVIEFPDEPALVLRQLDIICQRPDLPPKSVAPVAAATFAKLHAIEPMPRIFHMRDSEARCFTQLDRYFGETRQPDQQLACMQAACAYFPARNDFAGLLDHYQYRKDAAAQTRTPHRYGVHLG